MFSIGMQEYTHRPLQQSATLADHGLRLAALQTFRVYLGASAAHTLDLIFDGLSIRHFSTAKDDPGTRSMSPRAFYLAHCISVHPGRLSSTVVSQLQYFSWILKLHSGFRIIIIFALQYQQLPPSSWIPPTGFSATTRVVCWINILPFGPTESQPRPPFLSHVLLFLAIKSHFLSVVLSHDASVSVMSMKGQWAETREEANGIGVVAGAILMRALKGQANDCTRISIVLNQQLHFFKLIRLHKFRRLRRPFCSTLSLSESKRR